MIKNKEKILFCLIIILIQVIFSFNCNNIEIIQEVEDKPSIEKSYLKDIFIDPCPKLSGYITEDGIINTCKGNINTYWIGVGDNNNDNQVKGYLSFDTRDLKGKYIVNSEIIIDDFYLVGDPGFAQYLNFKIIDYGTHLESNDFKIDGKILSKIPINKPKYLVSNDNLKNEIRKTITSPVNQYFQICLELTNPTNDDEVADLIFFRLSKVRLHIKYKNH